LDIIKTTKSLAVLAGDLGRKDRQDLPSWVPDWSAAYNDLDRRRANNTENYSATSGCEVYMEDGKSELCYGFREYLGITGKETTEDPVKSFNEILGTTDWIAYLPDYNHGKNKPSEATCLAAIYRFYTVCGRAVGLKTHGDGVIALAGFQVDKIAFTGEVAFSDEVLLSVIYSWALLVSIHSLHPSYGRGTAGFRDAFRRTLCADITSTGSDTEGFTTRRINNDDYGLIATWFLQGSRAFLSPEILNKSWEISMIFKDNMDMGDIISYMEPKAVSPSIDAAIRSAAIRQRFFITEKGYIGLGPSAMRPGDYLHILMGGQTPFILRASGIRKLRVGRFEHPLERECFEVIGDCYTHGLMDGEAMQQWKEVADNTKHHFILQHLSQRRQDAVQKWHRRRSDLSDWERETDAVLLTEVRDCAKQRSISNEMLIKALRGVNESGGNAEAEERANLCTSNLSQWRDEISSWKESKGWWRDVGYLAALVNAAKLKILRITKEVADLKLEIDGIEAQINVWEEEAGKIIYLV
jgi:tellurite resistance protein